MKLFSSTLGSIRFWVVLNGTLVVLLVGAALFGSKGVIRHERLGEELGRVQLLNQDLSSENERLRAEVHALRHDPSYVESVIRDELGWVRDDEIIFHFPPSAGPGHAPEARRGKSAP